MANSYFQFKQFTICHDRCAMKVGTDGVLLGAWAASDKAPTRILDVGTGSGLIAIMLAQRFEHSTVRGIDIDSDSVKQARENAERSPFGCRITIEESDFSKVTYQDEKYSLIISNPPFYKEETLGGDARRDSARHTCSLPFQTLIANATKMLDDEGVFAVIIPTAAANNFVAECAFNNLYLHRRLDIKTTPRKVAKRTMLEFGKRMHETEKEELCMRDSNNNLSTEYVRLTEDFYL